MRKFLEQSTPSSCFNKSRSDEPIFVLCARDPTAPGAVRFWAANYRRRHLSRKTFNERREIKYESALTLADDMDRWARENVTVDTMRTVAP